MEVANSVTFLPIVQFLNIGTIFLKKLKCALFMIQNENYNRVELQIINKIESLAKPKGQLIAINLL